MRRLFGLAVLAAITPAAWAGNLDGRWDATVRIQGNEIPFRIDFSGDGDKFGEADKNLLKFHGTYQQEDRDARRARRGAPSGRPFIPSFSRRSARTVPRSSS